LAVFRKDSTPILPAPYSTPRAITASAARVRTEDRDEIEQFKQRRASSATQWQQEAWEYYDAVGEVKYAFSLVGSVISRIRLYAAVVVNPSESPVALSTTDTVDTQLSQAAERALARLDSAYGGQAGLLRDAALNLLVAGECYLVQMPERQGNGIPESWDIRSIDEVKMDAQGRLILVTRRDAGGVAPTLIPKNAFVGRIWRSHPRYTDEPDSSMKGVLDLCSELLLLNRTFRSTARSRLNAGALYLPDGLSLAAGPEGDYEYDENGDITNPTNEEEEDQFEDQLVDAMTTPISDESSASAVVPLIIRGPAELGDKIKQFKFERSFDPALAERADRVLDRIMQGIDVPKDVVTGLANVKYSNAVQIDESLYKAHIEPLMLLIADALTVVYLRPYLLSLGYDSVDVSRLVIWYDPSSIATRNDRAMDADLGFDKMAVSFDTWRRSHGFSESDAPSPTELAMRMMIERGGISPELTETLLQVFAPDAINAAKAASQATSDTPVPQEVVDALANATGGAPAEGADAPAEAETAPPADSEGPPVPLAEPTAS
jgi:hypothetical protein